MNKYDIELVGKVGSMALINKEYNDINYNVIARISRELRPGYVWITSGATEIGRLDFIRRNKYELDTSDSMYKSDYAAQGQTILMNKYREFIDPKYSIRQILVEHNHFNDDIRKEYIKKSILRCPVQNAIPIINYNDPVCSDEISKMEVENIRKVKRHAVECLDNDETASQIACLVKTKKLLILTSTDGILDDINDPKSLITSIEEKDVYSLIEKINYIQTKCSGASRKGANGAKAKLEYIKEPLKNGTEVIIANSKYSIKDILENKVHCTSIKVR